MWLFPILFGLSVAAVSLREVIASRRGQIRIRPTMTLHNLKLSVLRPLNVLTYGPVLLVYGALFAGSRDWHLGWSTSLWWHWIAAFLLTDFTFYVHHVLSHHCNLFWGAHSVHHQPTEMNISVGGATGILETSIRFLPALPLALIGLPLEMLGACNIAIAGYMTWIHTETIGKLGWAELVFNTPSHHRVHHYKNISELGGTRNFGGMLIVWDRIFGSFLPEKKRITLFGIHDRAPIYSPLKCQTYHYRYLFKTFWKIPWRDRPRLLFTTYLPGELPDESPVNHPPATFSKLHWTFIIVAMIFCFYGCRFAFTGLWNALRSGVLDRTIAIRAAAMSSVAAALIFALLFLVTELNNGKALSRRRWLLGLGCVTVLGIIYVAESESIEFTKSSAEAIVKLAIVFALL